MRQQKSHVAATRLAGSLVNALIPIAAPSEAAYLSLADDAFVVSHNGHPALASKALHRFWSLKFGLQQDKDIYSNMRTAAETAPKGTSPQEVPPKGRNSEALLKEVVAWLDEAKAEEIVSIDLAGKSSLGDFMIIATGRTDRHVGGIADQLRKKLKEAGVDGVRVEGMETCDWVIADAGDIIVHIFRQEVRDFYKLEKMWSAERPGETAH